MTKIKFPGLCGSQSPSWLFWDSDLSWNTDRPDLTLCFQYTILQWIPMVFLFAGSIVMIPLVWQQTTVHYRKRGKFNIMKSVLISFLFLVHIMSFCLVISESVSGLTTVPALYLQPVLSALSALLLIYLNRLYYQKQLHTSGYQFYYWFMQAFVSLILMYSRYQESDNNINSRVFRQVTSTMECIIVWILFISNCFADTSVFVNVSRRNTGKINRSFIEKFQEKSEYLNMMGDERKPLLEIGRRSDDDSIGDNSQMQMDNKVCPEIKASYLATLTFQWLSGLIVTGYKRSLTSADLFKLQHKYSATYLVPKLIQNWIKENFEATKKPIKKKHHYKASSSQGYQSLMGHEIEVDTKHSTKNVANDMLSEYKLPIYYKDLDSSFFGAYMRTFGWQYVYNGIQKLIYDASMFIQPQLLSLLIGAIENYDGHLWHGLLIVVVLYATSMLKTIVFQSYCFKCNEIGMEGRTAVIGIVYRKALRLSATTRKDSTVGQIVNLMSVDAQKINDITLYFHWSWTSPITIGVSLYFLWQQLGVSVMAGFLVLVLFIPLNILIGSKVKTLHDQQMKTKDSRIKLINEILNGIKILKLYAWEISFEKMIRNIRDEECSRLRISSILTSLSAASMFCTPFLVALVSFVTYVLISPDNVLTATKAFVSLSLFGILNIPMLILPATVINTIQGYVSMKRIDRFLKETELDPDIVEEAPPNKAPLSIIDADFSWDPNSAPTLKDVNLEVEEGSLIAIVGTVGSGKTSLVSAMLGEINRVRGRVLCRGSIAYVPQQAWCLNASLQDNILFNKSMNMTKYNKILQACSLVDDLKVLPAGDQTEIGEKGINLSGGQKQRISLARAVYQDSSIYILDDPLSAVDSHVGKHIFNNVLSEQGILSNKTRILVTHNLTFLPKVEKILVMNDGRITECGTYRELLDNNGDFSEYIRTYLEQEEEEMGSDVEDSEDETRELKRELRRSVSRGRDQESEKEKSLSSSGAYLASSVKRHKRTSSVRLSKSRSMIAKEEEVEMAIDKRKKLIQEEIAEVGGVRFSVFVSYVKMITLKCIVTAITMYLLYIAASTGANIFLSLWSETNSNAATTNTSSRDLFLQVYGGLGIANSVFVLLQYLSFSIGTYLASKSIHTKLLKKILRAPSSFFDTTPTGRILNRIGKDIDSVDTNIPNALRTWLSCASAVFITILIITFASLYFLIMFVPLCIAFFFVQRFYICTSRQLKRIDSIKRSPIYSHFSETIVGASCIRAYKAHNMFIDKLDRLTDENQMAWYPNIVSNRWLQFNLEFLANLIILSTGLLSVLTREYMGVGLAGLSVTYAIQMTSNLCFMVRTMCDLENQIVSIERIQEYDNIAEEADWVIENNRPYKEWPQYGRVEFKNYSVRYRPGLDLVLKNMDLVVEPGEKVGIVGRTGAGKSSLTLALFRLIEPASGSIVIDGIDITKIGLHDLRSQLTIIPQDPVLFSGTLRMNIDPFNKYSDGELWKSLELAHLKSFISNQREGLDYPVSEGGENLSVGQRQLVCLARALLKKTRILILDEATAAVDLETDELIQNSIRSQFKNCTVLTIAHRLNTIMDYDKVLVLDFGRIKELDSPENLLANESSSFYSMCRDAGLV